MHVPDSITVGPHRSSGSRRHQGDDQIPVRMEVPDRLRPGLFSEISLFPSLISVHDRWQWQHDHAQWHRFLYQWWSTSFDWLHGLTTFTAVHTASKGYRKYQWWRRNLTGQQRHASADQTRWFVSLNPDETSVLASSSSFLLGGMSSRSQASMINTSWTNFNSFKIVSITWNAPWPNATIAIDCFILAWLATFLFKLYFLFVVRC